MCSCVRPLNLTPLEPLVGLLVKLVASLLNPLLGARCSVRRGAALAPSASGINDAFCMSGENPAEWRNAAFLLVT